MQQHGSKTDTAGAALPVALIFLLVMTVLGVGTLGTNVMEEKMAGNSLNREIAFQAAEAALREGERHIETVGDIYLRVFYAGGASDNDKTIDNDGDQCVNGYCTPAHRDENANPAAKPGDADYLYDRWLQFDGDPNNLDVWTTPGRHIEYSNYSALGLAAPPRFIVEFLGHWIPDTGSLCDGPDVDLLPGDVVAADGLWPYCEGDPAMYRVTAMAETEAGARVMLQSTYRK